jgi:hypothetical protein
MRKVLSAIAPGPLSIHPSFLPSILPFFHPCTLPLFHSSIHSWGPGADNTPNPWREPEISTPGGTMFLIHIIRYATEQNLEVL